MKNSSLVFIGIGLLVFVAVILVSVLGQQAGFLSTRLWRDSVYPAGVPVEVPLELPDQADTACQSICQESCGSFDLAEQEQACFGECLGLCETEF